MKTKKNSKFSLLKLSLFLFLTIIFMFPASALASGSNVEDTVGKGEVLDRNVFLSGPNVVMDGVVKGDLVAAGDGIRINGEVDGSLIIAGKQVVLNGPVTGSAYVAALTLELGPQADIGRDVIFIGGGFELQESATIGRDLNLLSLESELSGQVNQQVNALVGPVNIIQTLFRWIQSRGWLPQTQRLEFRIPKAAGSGMAFGLPALGNLPLVLAAPERTYDLGVDPGIQTSQQSSGIDVERLKGWLFSFLRTLASLLILGLLGVWLVPTQLNWAGEQARSSPWWMLLTGLLVFIIGWLSTVLVFLLILAVAIFLYWISLPTLGFWAGMLGLMGLGLAVTVFWLSIAYFSKIIIASLVGRLLFKRYLPKYAQSRVWPLLVGVILYAVLASIPYLGWVVAVFITFAGLGALWIVAFPRRQPESEPAAMVQPA